MELERIEREIAESDAKIDNLVYELEAITEEETKIIERSYGGVGRTAHVGLRIASRCDHGG